LQEKDFYSKPLSYYTWQRLKKNKLAVFGIIVIALSVVVAVLGYLIMPDSSPDANNQMLELSIKPPGFKVKMLLKRKNEEAHKINFFTKMLFGEVSDYVEIPIHNYHFADNNIVYEEYTGAEVNNGMEVKLNLADALYAIDKKKSFESNEKAGYIEFYEIGSDIKQKKTNAEMRKEVEENNIITQTYLLGTDRAGRDVLSRLMIGTRISLAVGFISVIISLIIGVVLGAISGFFRGRVDDFIMWLINVVWSIPTLMLVIAITLVLGKGFWQVFIAVGLTMWVEVARVIRGQILSLREKEFIEACRALGYSNWRIIFKHIIPNVLGPIIVISASNFASAILVEAGLSFLGIGAQPPTSSWGSMINAHRGYIIVDAAYLAIIPGLAIMALVLAFMLLGNALRDALDAKAVDDDHVMGY
jgi:peptide/nickel transport system permease protein